MSDETYSLEDVERLLGLQEHPGPTAPRHLTLLDILSLARSPGGDPYWYLVARDSPKATENADWTDVVGPLSPDSDLALTLYDYERAVSELRRRGELSIREYAILSFCVTGWSAAEIALFLRANKRTVERNLRGRPRRDREGQPIPGERVGGLVGKVHAAMNGRNAKPPAPAEASAQHWSRL